MGVRDKYLFDVALNIGQDKPTLQSAIYTREGLVYFSENNVEKAEMYFIKSVKLDSNNKIAKKILLDIYIDYQ